ncbi:glycerol-3-phosphatase [Pararhizobium polonicum]|uniref:Glycerol-3-phosphatase n=2 Tax=Pararhizobium polonicum TaxID=1612624 RepID=A0A1C7P1J5_9HYPH|nr:glycerol-3-phosphatase [Pararhizobium polonicum]
MDGTLLDSTAVVERIWGDWATRHGFDPATFIRTIHGVRAIDVITPLGLDNVDPQLEALQLQALEMEDIDGIVPIAGVVDFLNGLPREKWAIVTSAPLELAKRRMAAAGIPMPGIIVSGEDVTYGKPDPACYRLGAERLGVDPADCLVFEDAPAGIRSGETAGAEIVVISATHRHPMKTMHLTLENYRQAGFHSDADGSLRLTIPVR